MGEKFSSIYEAREKISDLISRDELDSALRAVHGLVEEIFTEPLCTAVVFGSNTLDTLCQEIGSKAQLIADKSAQGKIPEHLERPIVVYIVSRLQRSGGHTRVIEEFIKVRKDAFHVVLSTEIGGASDMDYIQNFLFSDCQGVFEMAKEKSYLDRLVWLQRRLMDLPAQKVYLFNHHQDSVAVAAIQAGMELDAAFYHHGDHNLCLGVHLQHLKHIDPHPMGYHNCRENLGIRNVYIPLTMKDKGKRHNYRGFLSAGVITTCTVARMNKVEQPYFISYLDVLPRLIEATGGTHIHIGRLSPWILFKIRRSLARRGIPLERFKYIKWVPNVWKSLHELGVDLYVGSFPYGGGLTMIEAMGAGIPVALHRHAFSRMLGGIDLAYPEVFTWRYPEELYKYCRTVTADQLCADGERARQHFETYYSESVLQRVLSGDIEEAIEPPPLSHFEIEADEMAVWMRNQVSLSGLIKRSAYRVVRSLRAG